MCKSIPTPKMKIRAVGDFPTLEKEIILGRIDQASWIKSNIFEWPQKVEQKRHANLGYLGLLWRHQKHRVETKVRNKEVYDPRKFSDVVA